MNAVQPVDSPVDPPAVDPAAMDLVAALDGWLDEAADLTKQTGATALVAQLELLRRQRERPQFRVAVVGEFNRGKSTLVNRLVETALLPVGPVPTTRGFVVVSAAQRTMLTIRWPGGRVESRVPGLGLWDGLVIDEVTAESMPAPPQSGVAVPLELHLGLPCPWLDGLHGEIVDTPGANESAGNQDAEVRRAITLADGVLLVVSAASPLSRTERNLLEQEVLRRRIPFLAVVVSFLDQLAAADRSSTLAAITARVRRIAPGTSVLPAPGLPSGSDDGAAELAALRDLIGHFAAGNGNRYWRSRKLASAVAEVCDAVADIATLAAATAGLAEEQRRAELAREQAALARDNAIWERLRAELDSRRRALVQRLRDSLAADTAGIVASLRNDLLRAPDPKEFWERDVGCRLRHQLLTLTQRTESAVLDGLTADIAWLDDGLAERFAVTEPSRRPAVTLVQPRLGAQEKVRSYGMVKVLTLLGAPAGRILGELLGAATKLPKASAAAMEAAGGMVGEAIADRAIQVTKARQREEVDRRLEGLVRESLDDFADDVSHRLEKLYAELIDGLARRRVSWRSARSATLSGAVMLPDTSASDTAARASELARRIRLTIDGDHTPREIR